MSTLPLAAAAAKPSNPTAATPTIAVEAASPLPNAPATPDNPDILSLAAPAAEAVSPSLFFAASAAPDASPRPFLAASAVSASLSLAASAAALDSSSLSLSPDAAFLLSSRLLALSFTLLEVFSVSDPADRNAELTASQASLKFSLIFITLFMSIGASLNFPNNSEKDRITPSSKAIPSIAEPIRCSESMTSRALFSMSPSCLDALANMASMAFSNRFFTSSGVIACATSPSSSIVCTCPFFQPPFRRRSYAGALPNDHHLTVSVTRPAFSLPATKRQDKLIEWTRKAIDL